MTHYSLFLYIIFLEADPILPDGALNGNYLMMGLFAGFFFLLWQGWREVKTTLKELQQTAKKHELLHNDTAHILKGLKDDIIELKGNQ